jgi:jumonji domain-containing protein 2
MSEEITHCPVLHPTAKEFGNFHDYMYKLETTYGKEYGIVKVVPPRGWRARSKDYTKSLETEMIPSPIEQNVFGKGGIYECLHIIKKSMNFRDYQKKAADFDNVTNGKSEEEIEQLFLKNISFSPPVYGSDFMYTLFDERVQWNLAHLPSILNDGL